MDIFLCKQSLRLKYFRSNVLLSFIVYSHTFDIFRSFLEFPLINRHVLGDFQRFRYFFVSPVKPVCFIKLLSYVEGGYFLLFVLWSYSIFVSGIFKVKSDLISQPNKVRFFNSNSFGARSPRPQILHMLFVLDNFTFRLISCQFYGNEYFAKPRQLCSFLISSVTQTAVIPRCCYI